MNEHPQPSSVADDQPAIDALGEADPADAPDIAEGIAAGLQRELDRSDAPTADTTETSP